MQQLSQQQWADQKAAADDAYVLDVRTPEEYAEGHLEGSHLLDIRNPQGFMDGAEKLDKSLSYFIYCRSGARSAQACQLLDQMGVKATFNLDGGILAWTGNIIQ